VDFLAVTGRALSGADIAAVARAHRRLPRRPYLDGAYVTWPGAA